MPFKARQGKERHATIPTDRKTHGTHKGTHMREKDIFVVAERWTERRAPSGRWSKAKTNYRICLYNRSQFDMFLSERWRGERRSGYRYTMHGYFPSRVTVPNPYVPERSVTEFTFSDDRQFTDLLLDSHEEAK